MRSPLERRMDELERRVADGIDELCDAMLDLTNRMEILDRALHARMSAIDGQPLPEWMTKTPPPKQVGP